MECPNLLLPDFVDVARGAHSIFRSTASRLKNGLCNQKSDSSVSKIEDMTRENKKALERVLKLIDEHDVRWNPIVSSGRCRVWRLKNDQNQDNRHACILAKGTIEAPADRVYDLFAESVRAREFNEFCEECIDLEFPTSHVKISWSATKAFGMFKPRDFVTLCNFIDLDENTKIIINRAVEHDDKPPSSKYQRAQVILAANIIQHFTSNDGKQRTHLTLLTHVNPKGAIDSPIGAKISNMLIQRSPPAFFDAIEKCAAYHPAQIPHHHHHHHHHHHAPPSPYDDDNFDGDQLSSSSTSSQTTSPTRGIRNFFSPRRPLSA